MIGIEYSRNLPPDAVDFVRDFFVRHGGAVQVRVRENRTLNAIEWALPALLTVWIAKSYFDGLLKELGKETGSALKGLLLTLYSRVRGVNNRVYDADQLKQLAEGASPESLGRQGPALRLVVSLENSDGKQASSISVVVPDGLTDVEIEVATSSLVVGLASAVEHQQKLLDEYPKSVRPTSIIYTVADGWLTDCERIEKEANAAKAQKT